MIIGRIIRLWTGSSLILKIIVCLIIGAVLGILVSEWSIIGFPGKLFVNALKAIAPILVFVLVTSTISKAGKGIGSRFRTVIILYIFSTFLSAMVAIAGSMIFPVNIHLSTASSADKDKVSFFAYLPWVDVDPSTGWIKAGAEAYQRGTGDANMNYGITGVSRNTITGDPYVRYLSSFDTGKQVDLCWGVQGTSDSGTLNWATLNDATGQKIDNGLPWLNVLRPATIANGKVKFDFRHATSKLIMNIVAGDKFTNYSTSAAANKTRIYVRSVTLHGIAQQGVLNLNNTKPGQPLWMANNASEWFTPGQSVTITDGRADGLEATTPATNESNVFLNPVIIQNNAWPTANWSAAANQGVGRTAVSLFSKNGGVDATTASYVYVIPTNEKFQVSIVYDVETVVPDLPGYVSDGTTHGTSIENKITQTVKVGTADLILEAGKFYTINLTLGMNEVQFDATVTAWPSTTSGSANLPTPGA